MKRIFVSLIVLGMVFGSLGECRPVSEEEVKLVAEQWISYIVETEGSWEGSATPLIKQIEKLERDGLLLGYNIAVSPSGYILVPNETELPPVKSYSTKSRFDQVSLGYEYCIIAELLEVIKFIQERSKLRLPPVILSPSNQKAWDWLIKTQKGRSLVSSVQTISADWLIKTTWGQGGQPPDNTYNRKCPLLGGSSTPAGCTIVATGQVMKYWSFPSQGTGSYSYWWKKGNRTLTANFSDEYDWKNMPNSLSFSDTEIDAVSELLYEVGVAYETDYGTKSSGAHLGSATEILPKYFFYGNDIKKVNRRDMKDDEEWFDKFKEQRDKLHPALLAIWGTTTRESTKTVGHAVVVDGYRQITQNSTLINQVHINMGWSESYDSYYALNNIASSTSTWGFSFTFNNQYAVTDIHPKPSLKEYSGQDSVIDGNVKEGTSDYIRIKVTNPDLKRMDVVFSGNRLTSFYAKFMFYKGSDVSISDTLEFGINPIKPSYVIPISDPAQYDEIVILVGSTGRWPLGDGNYSIILRTPALLDVVLDTDRSGSMAGSKIAAAKKAGKLFIDNLEKPVDWWIFKKEDRDKIGLVSFSTNATLDLHLTSDFDKAKQIIDGYTAYGMTNMGDALSKSIKELNDNRRADALWSIVYLTDGQTNEGLTPDEIVDNLIPQAVKQQISIYTIGFGSGSNVDEDFLKLVAQTGNGKYYWSPDASTLSKIYTDLSQSAKGAKQTTSFSGNITQGEVKTVGSFDVWQGLNYIKVILVWPGSNLDLILVNPYGTPTEPGMPGVIYSGTNTLPEYYEIYNPEPGTWTIQVSGKEVVGSTQYDVSVFEPSALMQVNPTNWEIDYLASTTMTFTVKETSGNAELNNVTFIASDLTKTDSKSIKAMMKAWKQQNTGTISSTSFSFTPNNFTVPAGSSTNVQALFILPPNTPWGTYSGTIDVISNAGTSTIIVTLILPEIDLTPPTTSGTPTEGLPDIDISIGTYTVCWTPATDTESGIAFYEIQEKINQENWQTISSTTGTSTIISNRQAGNTYYYRVRAMNPFNFYGSYSASSDGISIVDQLFQINPNASYTLTLGKAKVEILPSTFAETITFTMSNLPIPSTQSSPRIISFLQDKAVEFLALNANNEHAQPIKGIKITLPYNDPNPGNEEEDLNYRIFRLNEVLNRWEVVLENHYIDNAKDTISIFLSSLSLYIVASPHLVAENLLTIRVYPNPFKPYDGNPDTGKPYDGSPNSGIIFDNLTQGCTIKIFNIVGELIFEKEGIAGKYQWDAKNKSGKEVASGVYIYLVTDKDNRKASGKIAIIR